MNKRVVGADINPIRAIPIQIEFNERITSAEIILPLIIVLECGHEAILPNDPNRYFFNGHAWQGLPATMHCKKCTKK